MSTIQVLKPDSFETWRNKTNSLSQNVGDLASLSASDNGNSYNTSSLVTFISGLQSKKLDRSGDTIQSLTVTNGLTATSTTSTNLTVTGSVAFSGSSINVGTVTAGTWSGNAIGVQYGGLGLTAATKGDIVYASANNTYARLSGNQTTTKKFLTQSGNGTTPNAPDWATLTLSDVDLTGWTGSTSISTVGTINTGVWNGTPISASKGGTGLTAVGTPNQILTTNAAGTAFVHRTFSSPDGSVSFAYTSTGIEVTSSATSSSQTINNVGKIGKQLLVGSVDTAASNTAIDVRPWDSATTATITYLIRGFSNATGTTQTFEVTTGGAVAMAGNLAVNTNKFVVTAANGNTAIAGTLNVTGVTTLSSLVTSGNLTVNTDKFVVTASNGNTAIAGTLGVAGAASFAAVNMSGNLTVNTDKFVVTAANGNTSIAGTLGVAGTTTLAALNMSGNLTIGTSKFTVNGSNGNTAIGGTLNVSGATTLNTVTSSSSTTTGNTVLGTVASTNQVTTSVSFSDVGDVLGFSTSTSSTTEAILAEIPISSYRSALYTVSASDSTGGKYQTSTILAIHNGTTLDFTEYASCTVGGNIYTALSVDISAGKLRLKATPISSNATVFRIIATANKT